jgi:hypothetical protein
MDDFNPDIEIGGFGDENNIAPKSNTLGKIMPILKPIIILLIIVGIGYFGYSYFFGNYIAVTITINQGDNPYLTTINIIEDGKIIKTQDTSEAFEIRPGKYTLDFPIPNNWYLSSGQQLLYVEENDSMQISKTIFLYPNWAKELKSVEGIFPSEIYKNQNVIINLKIQFEGSLQTVTIKGTGDFSEIEKEVTLERGTNNEKLIYVVPTNKDEVSGSFKILNTNSASGKLSAEVKDMPVVKVTQKPKDLDIKAGSEFEIAFTIKNQSMTELNDLNTVIKNLNGIESEIFMDEWLSPIIPFSIGGNSPFTQIIRGKIPLNTENKKITFKIKLVNSFMDLEIGDVSLDITEPDITITEKVNLEQINAGTSKNANLIVINNTPFEISEFNLELTNITGITNNTLEEVQLWFSIMPPEKIGAQGETTIPINFITPVTAKSDKFTATFKMTTEFNEWESKIDIDLIGINFDYEINMKDTFNVTVDEDGYAKTIADFIEIENKGDIAFKIRNLKIDKCPFATLGSIPTGLTEPGETKKIIIKLFSETQVPIESVLDISDCDLVFEYEHPLTQEYKNEKIPFIIQK